MPFEYVTNITAVRQVLLDHNTTTATPDLSADLVTRIGTTTSIVIGDPETQMVRFDDYPAIYIRVADKEEEAAGLGETGPARARKTANVTYDIIGLLGKESGIASHASVTTDLYRMARNIEGVFQQESNLSTTALWCHPSRTEFAAPLDIQGSLVKAVLIEVEARYHFR